MGQDAVDLMPREPTAWLAGLLGGEGCFALNGGSHPNIILSMTDRDVVERAHHIAGVGHVNQFATYGGKYKAQWRWKVSKKDHVFALCRVLLPFMGARRTAKIREILALDGPSTTVPIWVKLAE